MRRAALPFLVLVLTTASTAAADYDAARARLAGRRVALAAEYANATDGAARARVILRARKELARALRDELMPPWFGTPWEFHGTSEVPRQGTIACGYFVSTVLRDAGFRVERARLAQQASAHIIRTLVPRSRTWSYSRKSSADVAARVREKGDGVYVVGLDFHVGFLVVRGGDVDFCHSTYLEPVAVICEPAEDAAAFVSGYRVVGDVLSAETIEAWLAGRPFPTRSS